MDGKILYAEILKKKKPNENMDNFAARAGTRKSTLYNWRKGTEVTSIKGQEVLTQLGFSWSEIGRIIREATHIPRHEPTNLQEELEELVGDAVGSGPIDDQSFESSAHDDHYADCMERARSIAERIEDQRADLQTQIEDLEAQVTELKKRVTTLESQHAEKGKRARKQAEK
jgi:hypothetical protein